MSWSSSIFWRLFGHTGQTPHFQHIFLLQVLGCCCVWQSNTRSVLNPFRGEDFHFVKTCSWELKQARNCDRAACFSLIQGIRCSKNGQLLNQFFLRHPESWVFSSRYRPRILRWVLKKDRAHERQPCCTVMPFLDISLTFRVCRAFCAIFLWSLQRVILGDALRCILFLMWQPQFDWYSKTGSSRAFCLCQAFSKNIEI